MPSLLEAALESAEETLHDFGSSDRGLSGEEAAKRLATFGPNVLRVHHVAPVAIFLRQFRNPMLILLGAAAAVALFVGDQANGIIIFVISLLSVSVSFFNEYRSERAAEELHSRIRYRTLVIRGGTVTKIDVAALVPGDLVLLSTGDIVPADIRLIEAIEMQCDEAVISGESMPVDKSAGAKTDTDGEISLTNCALMGTVVKSGSGRGVVVRTGAQTDFGKLAAQLEREPAETAFQAGLRQFSLLLVRITALLIIPIFVLNWLLGRPLLESLLFALAIAVGMTPQLLPALVTISLSFGAAHLAKYSVLVKRLISIEDLGNITVLFTDKTGTLTEGHIGFLSAADINGQMSSAVYRLGLICNSAVFDAAGKAQGNALDVALWEAPVASPDLLSSVTILKTVPFSYASQRATVLAEIGESVVAIAKGSPESVFSVCGSVPASAEKWLERQYSAGRRVIAVASRAMHSPDHSVPETGFTLQGFLVFADPIKRGIKKSLQRLENLGIELKILTGDSERVAHRLCRDVGLKVQATMTGSEVSTLDDAQLRAVIPETTIFARVTPEQKSRIIRLQRELGADVGFLGDGVNDAVALHDADVGISVDSAADVAKDAADIVLLDKDLGILADGVIEGRKIFANTIKYVLMGTSSNFGNMFSAAGASLFLPFLPMTATQVLLLNLLYDAGEMTIPTDRVDEELVKRPAHWDIGYIRRFMIIFGPISSIFDFTTFGVMRWIFHADANLFQSGWFVESMATEALVIFLIRTHRVPFVSSRPGPLLAVTTLACVATAALIPFTPLREIFGFVALPAFYFLVLMGMVGVYLILVETAKYIFYSRITPAATLSIRLDTRSRRVHRIRTRWHAWDGAGPKLSRGRRVARPKDSGKRRESG